MKKKIGELTVAIEPTKRGFKGALLYEGGPFAQKVEEHERVLVEVKGKTVDDVLAMAKAWLVKRTPKKILGACVRCRNGVELEQTLVDGQMQIHCNACCAVVYRGVPISWA